MVDTSDEYIIKGMWWERNLIQTDRPNENRKDTSSYFGSRIWEWLRSLERWPHSHYGTVSLCFLCCRATLLRFCPHPLSYVQSTLHSPYTSSLLSQTYSNLSNLKKFFFHDPDFTSWPASFLLLLTFQFNKGKSIVSISIPLF